VSAKGVSFAGHSLGLEKIKARFSLRSAMSTTARRWEEVERGSGWEKRAKNKSEKAWIKSVNKNRE
jgi:hypothetical protein